MRLPHPLKWPGGKRWLVPVLKYIWESANRPRLVEPFCGGLGVALGLRPEQALLNDNNKHAINFFRWVQKGLPVTILMKNDKSLFYQHRSRFNELIKNGKANTAEAAELFYYLNRTGYNGLCRFNQAGGFNVPFGQHQKIPYLKNFQAYQSIIAGWVFTAGDFSKLKLQSSDFIYADPPYDVPFTAYTAGGFKWKEQERLVKWLAKHEGPVVLSNQATSRIEELYKGHGYQLLFVKAPRSISCLGDRKAVKEILALRNFPANFWERNDKFISSLL